MLIVKKFSFLLGFSLVSVLAACGGGSSDSGDTNTTGDEGEGSNSGNTNLLTGIFVDSAVEGVSYTTETQSGVTNSSGEFSYLQGENVIFSIGSLSFPSITAAAQVSPVDMAASSSDPAATTTNIARLLQSLDQDGNSDNGITISEASITSATSLDFDVSTDEFANETAVINLVANSGSVTTTLISSEDANAHLNSTLGSSSEGSSNSDIDGLWLRESASESATGVPSYIYFQGNESTNFFGGASDTDGECYTASQATLTDLGNNVFSVEGQSETIMVVRVGETIELTPEGSTTRIYPRVTGVDPSLLQICS